MGMHMRPAQLFVKTITPFPCDVTVVANGKADKRQEHHEPDGRLHQAGHRDRDPLRRRAGEAECLKAAVELVDSGLGE